MDIDELIVRLERLDIADAVNIAIDRNREKAEGRVINQLTHGYDSEGRRLQKYSDSRYATKKSKINPLPGFGNPDLRLKDEKFVKGDDTFYDSIYSKIQDSELQFDVKGMSVGNGFNLSSHLVSKYGNKIIDLNAENVRNFADDITPDFQRVITQITGLEFA